MSMFSNLFSSETTRQIEVKFHVEPPWDIGRKVCSNGPGHMTKVAATTIYDKNSSKERIALNRGLGSIIVQIITLG